MSALTALATDLDPALPTSAGAAAMVAATLLAVVALLVAIGFLVVRLTR